MVFKYIVHDYKGRASLMKLAKSILCILGWVLLLCLSFIAILVPISELRYVFTMAPYPYMLYGECYKFIEFIGGGNTHNLLCCLVVNIFAYTVIVFVGIYKGARHKYIQSCILLSIPVVMEIVLNLLSYFNTKIRHLSCAYGRNHQKKAIHMGGFS